MKKPAGLRSRRLSAPSKRLFADRREIHRGIFSATVYLDLELQLVALIEGRHAGALDRRNVHERIRLSVVALNEAEALHRVEELDYAGRLLARQLSLGSALGPFDCHRLALDSKGGRRDPSATVHERELKRLAVREVGQTGLLDSRDVDEHVLTAVVTDDEAEALLRVEEFDDTLALADDLRGHSATAARPPQSGPRRRESPRRHRHRRSRRGPKNRRVRRSCCSHHRRNRRACHGRDHRGPPYALYRNP